MIRFGSMSIILLCGALYGALRAAMLCFIPANRAANRFLAALIAALVLFTFPYIIGDAGYYDAYPWLSFGPYNVTLAIGPLLYLYLGYLFDGGMHPPSRWDLHLMPALAQLVCNSILFAQPLAFKNAWDAQVHLPYVDPPETLALMASLTGDWSLAFRRYRQTAGAGRESRLEWARGPEFQRGDQPASGRCSHRCPAPGRRRPAGTRYRAVGRLQLESRFQTRLQALHRRNPGGIPAAPEPAPAGLNFRIVPDHIFHALPMILGRPAPAPGLQ